MKTQNTNKASSTGDALIGAGIILLIVSAIFTLVSIFLTN